MRWPPEPEIVALVLGFIVAAVVTLLATPLVRRVAISLGVVDRPEARRVNTQPIARGGGFALAIGFLPVATFLLWLNAQPGSHFLEQPHEIGGGQLAALLGGALLAVFIGGLDDYFQLRARWQFLGQLALAAVAISLGVLVARLNDPFNAHATIPLEGVLAVVVTLFWIVGMINSINFIDGLDGLSSGIALIAALTLGGISLTQEVGEPFVALFCFTLAGALAGFLRWNFHPASIFAGTSGTVLVGYTLAVLSVLGTAKVAVALLVLGVPIIDTFWIIIRRLASGRAPFSPDRGHIHHRLLDLGLSHRNTVLVIYVVCAALALLSFRLSGTGVMYAFLGLVVLSGLGLVVIARVTPGGSEIDENLDRETYEPGAAPDAGGVEGRAATPSPMAASGRVPAASTAASVAPVPPEVTEAPATPRSRASGGPPDSPDGPARPDAPGAPAPPDGPLAPEAPAGGRKAGRPNPPASG